MPFNSTSEASYVAHTNIFVVLEVKQHAVSRFKEREGRLSHGTTQHSDCISDVRSGVDGTIQESAHQALVDFQKRRVNDTRVLQ